MDMNKKVKCNECKYKTNDKNIGNFLCKKCSKEIGKPIKWWVILLTGVIGCIFYNYYEVSMISFTLGLCIGAILILSIRTENKKNDNK